MVSSEVVSNTLSPDRIYQHKYVAHHHIHTSDRCTNRSLMWSELIIASQAGLHNIMLSRSFHGEGIS